MYMSATHSLLVPKGQTLPLPTVRPSQSGHDSLDILLRLPLPELELI